MRSVEDVINLAVLRLGQATTFGGHVHPGQRTKLTYQRIESLVSTVLPWLWSRRELLPMKYAPLLCFKCAVWIIQHGLHLNPSGLELLGCLSHGNRDFCKLLRPAEYIAWLESLSAAQDVVTGRQGQVL